MRKRLSGFALSPEPAAQMFVPQRCVLLLTAFATLAFPLVAQTPATLPAQTATGQAAAQTGEQPAADSVYTLRANARLVIEDVLVTDAHGNAVKGLPRAAFHVTDDGKPQQVRNFEESATGNITAAAAPVKPGEFSNTAMLGNSGPIAVLLLDPIGAEIADQMYLRLQVLHTLDRLPPETQIAVFRTSAHGVPLLVQGLTEDRGLLRAAISNSVPSFSTPSSSRFSNGLVEIAGITSYLGQIPGRKSLLWFASTFPLSETPGGPESQHSAGYDAQQDSLKSAYRALEKARVAVFPIDLRGVVNVNLSLATRSDDSGTPVDAANSQIGGHVAALPGEDVAQRSSWNAMDAIAESTGGRAFYSNNDLDSVTRQALQLGSHAYSLTYSPQPYASDGTWHKVRITVDGGYNISYRQGYYAEAASGPPGGMERAASQPANGATATGEAETTVQQARLETPIVFLAKLESTEPEQSKKPSHFVIHYSIAARDLHFADASGGIQEASLKVAALAYNGDGAVLSSAVDTVDTHYDAKQMELADRVGVPMLQQIAIAHGAKYLLLSVVDTKTGRTGTVQLTVATARANSGAEAK